MEQIRIAILNPYNKVLAFLDNTVPNAMHYFDEILHTYLKGSSYTFEFTTMTAHDDAVFLVEGNKLSFKRKGKDYHLTIMSVEKGGDTTTVTAYGLCLELTNEYVDAYKATKAMSFVDYVNAYGFERSFTIGKNEVSNKKITHEWTGTDTVLARLYSIANVFDAELEFVTELNDDYSLKNVVLNIYRAHSDSVQGMGTDKRSTILRYPNDVYGITKTSDITEFYTAIRPTGTNGLQLNSISGRTVKDSNGNVLYKVQGNNILAPQSRDRFPSTLITNHSNDMYAVQIWSYETENVETLYGQALAQLKKNCVPKVTYDVDAYIDADIGDTFTIEDAEYSPTLYLEARITEQEICFTDSEKCKTIFDNFEEKQSQISSALISEMNKMIELKKVYEGSIVSSNGVLFKNDSDSTKLTALVKDDGVDITSKYSITWFKDDVQISTSQTITVSVSDLSEKAVYRFKAMSGEILKASAEVTVMRLQDGQNGTSAYVHIAYANSSDGRVDFSLTDSNRKFIGQYSDSKQYGSDDPTKYRWSVIKGEDGQSFVSAEEQFYYSTSQTELIGGEWFVGNVVYQSDKFLWKRWKCTYANPSEIKYTKAVFDNTWNEIDAKIGEIHTQVSQANTQSKEAVDKAAQAQTTASKANELANTANTQSSEAKKLAQDANASTGKAQQQIDAIKGDITDSKKQIQSAVDQANANAKEINSVKETYATKVDLTNESKTIHADVSTEIEKKVGELSTTVSQTYASKSALTKIEGSLNTKIKQNADSITTQASSIEKLQSDTTQAQKDITDATKKATDAQTLADKALGNAQSAQTLADQAKKQADSAQLNLDSANKELVAAKKNLESVTGRVDSSEKEISDAKTRLSKAESDVTQAQKDATTAQNNAQTAINNAKTAQSTADAAKANADKAQKDLADLTNKVTSNTTAIEQNAKDITLQATKITETSNKIDNLKIGGRNIATSTNLGTRGWLWSMKEGDYTASEIVENGVRTCKLTRGSVTQTGWSVIGFEKINREMWLPNTTYTISMDVKASIDTIMKLNVMTLSGTDSLLQEDYIANNIKANEWVKLVWVVKTKSTLPSVKRQIIYLTQMASGPGRWYQFRNLKIEEGTIATAYSPAPEDLENDLHNNYYSKTQTDAQIKVSADKITQSVSEVYETKTSVTSKVNTAKQDVINSSKSYADTKKQEAINSASTDATNKVNSAKNELNIKINGIQVGGRNLFLKTKNEVGYGGRFSKGENVNEFGTVWCTYVGDSFTDLNPNQSVLLIPKIEQTYTIQMMARGRVYRTYAYDGYDLSNINLLNVKTVEYNNSDGIYNGDTNPLTFVETFSSSKLDSWGNLKPGTTHTVGDIERIVIRYKNELYDAYFYVASAHDVSFSGYYVFVGKQTGGKISQYWYPRVYGNGIHDSKHSFSLTDKWELYSYQWTPGTNLDSETQHDIILCRLENTVGVGTVEIYAPKFELGNKATDWTPAPEDVDNAINEERTTRQSAIETKANEITSKVSETYVSNSAFEHYQNTVSSQFTQTKKDFTWSINQSVTDAKNEMSGQIDNVNGRVDGLKQTTDNVNSYMSFDNDGLTLGKSDSAFKTKITNQEWSIQKNGEKVTYINDQTMYITDGQFTQSLKIGNFGFVPRANGSLDFKKIR